jgi:hypothetical protein
MRMTRGRLRVDAHGGLAAPAQRPARKRQLGGLGEGGALDIPLKWERLHQGWQLQFGRLPPIQNSFDDVGRKQCKLKERPT